MKITFEFATQDDCLDKLVPSDLRALVVERDSLIAKLTAVQEVVDHYRTRQVPAVNAIEFGPFALAEGPIATASVPVVVVCPPANTVELYPYAIPLNAKE